ncbi:MAG: hypothetical protein NTU64_12235, partial [Hyphomicrobiales bacterium]|nr:hypothetical protein [Hyphomicrobiales bacterium]
PASAVASFTPAISGMSGTLVGARGETAEDMCEPCHHRAGAKRRDPVISIDEARTCLPKRDGTRNSGMPELRNYIHAQVG